MQTELPFGEAEGTHAERRELLDLACIRVEADLHLCRFVQWVFESTSGGLSGELLKSYEELRARPRGLACSRSKARSTVRTAVHYGFVTCSENRYVSNGQKANAYGIDWDGVRRLCRASVRPGSALRSASGAETEMAASGASLIPAVVSQQPPVVSQHPPVVSQQGDVATRQPYKGINSFSGSSSNSFSNPGPGPGRPGPEILLEHFPELADWQRILVSPRPLGESLRGSVYCALTVRDLEPWPLLQWFQQQLSAPQPVLRGTRLDLCAAIAAGIYARKLRDAQRPVGVFVSVVSRGAWHRVLRHVAEARDAIEFMSAKANAIRMGVNSHA